MSRQDREVLSPIGKADHSVLTWSFHTGVNQMCRRDLYRYDYNKADYGRLCELLGDMDWSMVMNATDVNDAWKIFHSNLNEVVKQCVPMVKITNHNKINPPWFNEKVKRCVKRKYYAWKRYLERRSSIRYREYVRKRNALNKKLRIVKKQYEKDLCKKIKINPKAFFMYVNSKTKSRGAISKLKTEKGHEVKDDKDIAEELNSFFQSVFVEENDKPEIWFNDFMYFVYGDSVGDPFDGSRRVGDSILENIFFTPSDVQKLLVNINQNKATGPDEIHPRVLKEAAGVLYLPLYCILRQSLDQGKLPEMWKMANVTPIFKKGDRTATGNYRPVSLTSQVCKICEKLVKNGIFRFIEKNGLLCDEQHVFR